MSNNETRKISELIKKYRKINNLTQSDLAKMLFVSKQAVSRWENNLSLPDISMYPKLSIMLGVTVDELMGKKMVKRNNKRIIIFIILLFLLIIEIFSFNLISNNLKTLSDEDKYLKICEQDLNMTLSNVKLFEYNDLTSWVLYNDNYPDSMYYFVFENDFTKISNKFKLKLTNEEISTIPLNALNYLDTCDYFYLKKENDNYRLYCLQIVNKRLIVIN